MVKRRRKINSPDEAAEFYKIYVPELCTQRLRIPPAFLENFDGVLPQKFMLKSPILRSHWVHMNIIEGNQYFQEDWQKFVEDHHLEHGDLLIFTYAGNSKFYVKIFGKNSCKKELVMKKSKSEGTTFPVKFNHNKQPILRPKNRLFVQEKDGARKNASRNGSANPSFKVVLTPSYVHHGFLHVPTEFKRSHMKEIRLTVKLCRGNKRWRVKLCAQKTRHMFSQGFQYFIADNNLQVGDACTFELVSRTSYVLNVEIDRCSD